jgi:hypothetical protein
MISGRAAQKKKEPTMVVASQTPTRQVYRISQRHEILFDVRAESYERAADIAAHRLYGRRRISAQRTTGNRELSGYFQAYRDVSAQNPPYCLTSVGEAFHVGS